MALFWQADELAVQPCLPRLETLVLYGLPQNYAWSSLADIFDRLKSVKTLDLLDDLELMRGFERKDGQFVLPQDVANITCLRGLQTLGLPDVTVRDVNDLKSLASLTLLKKLRVQTVRVIEPVVVDRTTSVIPVAERGILAFAFLSKLPSLTDLTCVWDYSTRAVSSFLAAGATFATVTRLKLFARPIVSAKPWRVRLEKFPAVDTLELRYQAPGGNPYHTCLRSLRSLTSLTQLKPLREFIFAASTASAVELSRVAAGRAQQPRDLESTISSDDKDAIRALRRSLDKVVIRVRWIRADE